MKNKSSRMAVIAYLPILGWLYVYFLTRDDELAMFHLRQSIGLIVFLIAVFLAWAIAAWLLAWFPYLVALGAGLFAFVIAAFLFGFVVLILGIINAYNLKSTALPIFGGWASRLPIR